MGSLHTSALNPYTERQTRLPGWGSAGQARVAASSVLVVGAGGLGCPALEYLVRAGTGSVTIVDPDVVEISNLGRQSLYTIENCGVLKVSAAAARLSTTNPAVRVVPLAESLSIRTVRKLVESHDLVLDCTDNFAAKFLLHDACRSAKKPFVLASLYQWESQLQVFAFHQHQQGCLHCLYPQVPQDGCIGTCADVGVSGALAGMAGCAQALAGLRLLLGLETLEHGTTLIWDSTDMSSSKLRWHADPQCSFCSTAAHWDWLVPTEGATVALKKSWGQLSPSEKSHIIDIREPSEIGPDDWKTLSQAGAEVLFFPWSQWRTTRPILLADHTYLVSCARGARSKAALLAWAPIQNVSLISLSGGYESIRHQLASL